MQYTNWIREANKPLSMINLAWKQIFYLPAHPHCHQKHSNQWKIWNLSSFIPQDSCYLVWGNLPRCSNHIPKGKREITTSTTSQSFAPLRTISLHMDKCIHLATSPDSTHTHTFPKLPRTCSRKVASFLLPLQRTKNCYLSKTSFSPLQLMCSSSKFSHMSSRGIHFRTEISETKTNSRKKRQKPR